MESVSYWFYFNESAGDDDAENDESAGNNDAEDNAIGENHIIREGSTELPSEFINTPIDVPTDGEKNTTGPEKLIEEVVEIKIKAKMLYDIKTRMSNKATKVDKKLKKFRPHFQHLVIYQSHEVKQSIFRSIMDRDKKVGGCITVLPSLTTTKRRVRFLKVLSMSIDN